MLQGLEMQMVSATISWLAGGGGLCRPSLPGGDSLPQQAHRTHDASVAIHCPSGNCHHLLLVMGGQRACQVATSSHCPVLKQSCNQLTVRCSGALSSCCAALASFPSVPAASQMAHAQAGCVAKPDARVCGTAQALLKGEWGKAYDYLAALPSWSLVSGKEGVLAMLKRQLQEEGLRTYLLAYGSFYHSLSHKHLSSMFDLPDKKVGDACSWM